MGSTRGGKEDGCKESRKEHWTGVMMAVGRRESGRTAQVWPVRYICLEDHGVVLNIKPVRSDS